MTMSICQICGQRLSSSEMSSDPLQHFCIGLDGPAIVQMSSFMPKCLDSDSEDDQILKKNVPAAPKSKSAALSVHNPEDLEEIRQLHNEIEQLRALMGPQSSKPVVIEVPKPTAIKA